ncbi:chromosomal replication initiator DnaA [Sulfitobacter sp. JB4-11]|uniref:chromosomal replication initiator DnaA n=1 Tax=Sulfitobacter rhodophyticola TaxID=3238304 RepID=UPI0035182EA0
MTRQLGLDLPSHPALDREAFFAAPCNRMALGMIERWPDWPGGKLVLSGPKGAGKTHLAHVWAEGSGAVIVSAADLATADIPALAQNHVAVEDVPEIGSTPACETALFHLHNLALANGQTLLLTGVGPVAGWGLTLPDLISRLRGTTAITIAEADDVLLGVLLAKLLDDRQLHPGPKLIPYLLRRMDRSFAAAIALTQALDAASLAGKRPITTKLAGEVLDALDKADPSRDS